MMWIGILPAFVVFFIMKGVKESPVWLERQRHLKARSEKDSLSLPRLLNELAILLRVRAVEERPLQLFHYRDKQQREVHVAPLGTEGLLRAHAGTFAIYVLLKIVFALLMSAARRDSGATVFGYYVQDPERYGVAEFDASGRVHVGGLGELDEVRAGAGNVARDLDRQPVVDEVARLELLALECRGCALDGCRREEMRQTAAEAPADRLRGGLPFHSSTPA